MRARRGASYVALGVMGLGLLPPVQARAKALAVLAEALGARLPRPFASSIQRAETSLDDVSGDIYLPASDAPAILLLPGAAPEGRNDARVVRLAGALAKAERVVFVPDLDLVDKRFTRADVDRIVRAALALRSHPRVSGKVVILGFSYGGSFGLLAAADERLASAVEVVVTFGAYYDLVGYIQAVTTGVSLVDDARLRWEPHPRAREVLQTVMLELAPAAVRAPLRAALAGETEPEKLPAAARAVYDLLENRDPERTNELARELPADLREVLRAFSPSSVAGALRAPVLALHSRDDPVVPYGEGVRLDRSIAEARLYTVSLFRHVDLRVGSWLGAAEDLITAWRFAADMLSAQE